MLQGLGTFIIPLLCGYWFLTHCNFTKFRSLRDSGYHVLFRSAIFGLVLFVLSHIVARFLDSVFPVSQNFEVWQDWMPIESSVPLTLTIFVAWLLPIVFNNFYSEIKSARKVAKQNGDFIELLIDQSTNEELFIELSLRSGKSYMGYVIESQLPRQSEADVVLVPMASGYRNLETRELEFTTHYFSIFDKFDNKEIDDFRIVIPMSEIISVRLFDEEVYSHFQDVKSSENNLEKNRELDRSAFIDHLNYFPKQE